MNGGNGMCNYPVSNIQYPLFNDGGANWILDIGCWLLDICTFPHSTRKEQPMKPFARINFSSVLSSVALAKGDALRRGSGKCENV